MLLQYGPIFTDIFDCTFSLEQSSILVNILQNCYFVSCHLRLYLPVH